MDPIVLDSSAVLAFFLGERGGAEVKRELRACRNGKRHGLLSAASLAEIHRRMRRGMDRETARRMLDALLLTPLTLVPLEREVAGEAADLSHESGAGLMDSIVAATARPSKAVVITADPDFRRLEARVKVTYIR